MIICKLQDCRLGKIDLILTKSVTRFARNTVDSLMNIRKLKEKNIAAFFEKEGINTLEGSGELLITILSSLAQEESRNISENCHWVQEEKARRASIHRPAAKKKGGEVKEKYGAKYALSDIMVCAECGHPYRWQVWSKYERNLQTKYSIRSTAS